MRISIDTDLNPLWEALQDDPNNIGVLIETNESLEKPAEHFISFLNILIFSRLPCLERPFPGPTSEAR